MATSRFIDAAHMAEWLERVDEDELAAIAGVFRAAGVPGIDEMSLGDGFVVQSGRLTEEGRRAMLAIAEVIQRHLETGERMLPGFEELAEHLDITQAEMEIARLERLWAL
jgi:hypothetical protein